MKRKFFVFSMFLMMLLSFSATSFAGEAELTPPVKPDDTAQYQMIVTTMGGFQGMHSSRMLQLDARGKPVVGSPQKAWHDIPPGMKMGKSLPLIRPEKYTGGYGGEGSKSEPTEWRMKIYWSCAKVVPQGQPIILSSANKNNKRENELFDAYSGRRGVWKGDPPIGWGWGQWPNKESTVSVRKDSSLKGDHLVHGNYLPHIKFAMAQHDFLQPLEVKTGDGNLNAHIPITWKTVPGAIGYFIYATAGNAAKNETVIWTSSAKATYGIQMHEHSSRIKELVNMGIVLKPDRVECNIPAGIFAGYENPMIMMYAWGEDFWASYPPKPANPPKGWKPDWTVNGLFLSQWMGMPGQEIPAMDGASQEDDEEEQAEEAKEPSKEETPKTKKTKEKEKPESSGPPINIHIPIKIF